MLVKKTKLKVWGILLVMSLFLNISDASALRALSNGEGCFCNVSFENGLRERIVPFSQTDTQERQCEDATSHPDDASIDIFNCQFILGEVTEADKPRVDPRVTNAKDSLGESPLRSDTNESTATLKSGIQGLNKLPKGTTPQSLIGRVIRAAMGIIGTIALIMILYAGILWMVDTGSSKRAEEAKDILLWGIVGLVVTFASYAIIGFIVGNAFTP